jgi:S-(hydroxymethyl)glutathione dehydrogenase/alcohol dehydrogenase
MKTVAAILVEQRKPLEIDEVDIPALSYGQVLVHVKCTRICGSQLGEVAGVKGPDKYLPHLLGHEGGGVVLEVGPEVTKVKAGDRVMLHWRPGTGIQARPAVYSRRGERVNAGNITTFQEYTVVSENRVTLLPDSASFELASLMADTLTTGFGSVCRVGRLELGESAAVIGVGGIGMGAVLGAHLAGAAPLIAVDVVDHKLEAARRFGASAVINSRSQDLPTELARLCKAPLDLIIETSGRPQVIEQAWSCLGPKGRLVLVGVMPHDQQLRLNTLPMHFGKRLLATEGGESQPAQDLPRYLRLLERSGLDATSMISHRVPLTKVNEAMERMRSGESLHTLILF